MAVVTRSAVGEPAALARELIQVDVLGGEVAIVELDLGGRLDFEAMAAEHRGAEGRPASPYAMIPQLLARCVRAADDEPLFTAAQWQTFGARNRDAAIALFNAAMRLNGFDGAENRKN